MFIVLSVEFIAQMDLTLRTLKTLLTFNCFYCVALAGKAFEEIIPQAAPTVNHMLPFGQTFDSQTLTFFTNFINSSQDTYKPPAFIKYCSGQNNT